MKIFLLLVGFCVLMMLIGRRRHKRNERVYGEYDPKQDFI